MSRFFSLFGAAVLALFGYAAYTGWTWASYEEIRNVPRSIRDNPGIYRSVYTRYPHK